VEQVGVRVSLDGPVGAITLDRPDKRNAVDHAMWTALEAACRQLAEDDAVRVVVLRGAGNHFCAGADINDLLAARGDGERPFLEVNMAAEDALATLPKPTVAAIHGDCIGGGAALAIDCDIRIASSTARFGITPSKLGIVYPAASLERAVRLLGPAAKRLLFTGDLIDAEDAHRIGLVDEVVEPGLLDDRVAALCDTLASRSLLTQAATKEMVAAVMADGAVPVAMAAQWSHVAESSGETAEGVVAFRERRPPLFPWRGHSSRS